MSLSSGWPGSSRRWMPSIPAISIAENARYGLQVGSGKRTSIRLALGDGEYIGIRTEADRLRLESAGVVRAPKTGAARLRLEYARLIGASKPGTSRRYEFVPGLVNAASEGA